MSRMTRTGRMYLEGEHVWLAEWEEEPRQRATILAYDNEMYTVEIHTSDIHEENDDGLRDVSGDQIEGYCPSEEWERA